MAGSGTRVSIPATTRKMIQNIKESTAGNYSEDEILVMLHECDMDPDETVQRLLLQDPFHEVKRKRDKRKENLSNKDSTESRWRSSSQGRGNRGIRSNFSDRHASHGSDGPKNSFKKENESKQVLEKALIGASSSTSQEMKNKEAASVSSSSAVLANGSSRLPSGGYDVQHASELPASLVQPKAHACSVTANKLDSTKSSLETSKNHGVAFGSGDMHAQLKSVESMMHPLPSSSDARYSSSGPKLGSDQAAQEQNLAENKFSGRSVGAGKTHLTDSHFSRPTSAHSNSTGSRPSSNYNNRSQQTIGQRAGCGKEWKPKPVNQNPSQVSGALSSPKVPAISAEASEKSLCVQDILPSAEETSSLQKNLQDLHIPQRQHVIIPNHILVPEAERTKLSFGSFDAGFPLTSGLVAGPENGKSSTPLSQTSQDFEESLEEETLSNQNASAVEKEGERPDNSASSSQVPDDLAGERAIPTSTTKYDDSKQESTMASESNQNSLGNAANYGMEFAPPVLGSRVPQFENTDSQARDALCVPSFVVQQPFDPASYYAQFYHSSTETDGHVSPFVAPGVATKFNGSVTVLPSHSSQSPQEGRNTLVLSAAGPTPLVTQAAGLMQSSIAVTQQPVPVFRTPPGMHVSHYPPNYISYGHYFSPFYVPPPAMHQFLSNGAFPQQPQAGGVYPAPPPGAATLGKYSLPQYKTATNTGNLTHVAMASGYGPYGSFPGCYVPGSAASAGNSTSNEDHNTSQLKENSGYSTGQQSEAVPIWVAGPGRDVSGLPTSSFYSLQHQGPHVTYGPTQAAHVTFPNMYHPAQAVTAATVHPLMQQSQAVAGPDMGAPAASVFQQPQQTQMNWPSNY